MNKKNICIILDHELKNYRLAFFNALADNFNNVHVIHPGSKDFIDLKFSHESVKVKKNKFFEFRVYPDLNDYDIVVHMQNIRIINLWLLSLNPFKKYSLYHWGIGWSSSKGLDRDNLVIYILRCFLMLISNGTIFYSNTIRNRYPKFIKHKTYVAPNTISNNLTMDCSGLEKDCFIFIGTLNSRKGLDELIDAYSRYVLNSKYNIFNLIIIGDGAYKETLRRLILEKGLSDKVEMVGAISSESEKVKYFKRAVACVSPRQAGLSILESFSYGVPFICYKNAISGGEHFNIDNGKNGFLVKNVNELYYILLKLSNDPDLYRSLGKHAFDFYTSGRTIEHMVNGFCEAFD
ncbi:glycosyltransferase family 4 protein [Vibrio parahaemolyticus]|nr:glycosyltransferase family 4 protein [Vibrio parahaemolyticus]HAS6628211.1 glycosyltransferase [Vibrio parahaemolyticus]